MSRTRPATAADLERVVDAVTEAFAGDPAWTWVFDDPAQYRAQARPVWKLFVEGALLHDSVHVIDDGKAVSVWVTPGHDELSAEQATELEVYLDGLPAPVAARTRLLMERFDAAHPHDAPHHYLSLLATHPDHRGHGLGIALLADDLARIDAEGSAAYLESTNPRNLDRYGAQGFEIRDTFDVPGGPTVTTMLRPGRPPAP